MSLLKENRNIKLLHLANLITGFAFIIPIWVSFERQYLTFAQMAFIEMIMYTAGILLELPTGAFADLIGKKRTTALGWIISGIGNGVVAFAQSGTLIGIGFAITGIGGALISGANTALIYDTMKDLGKEKEYPKIASSLGLEYQISLIIATLCGGYLYQFWKGLPFFMYAFTMIIGGVIYILVKEPKTDSQVFTLKKYVRQNIDGLKQLTKNAYIKYFSVFYILIGGITWSNMVFFNQPFATEIGYNEIGKSWLFSLLRLFNAVVLFKLLHAEKIITKKRAFLIFPLVILISSLLSFTQNQIIGTFALLLLMILSTSRFIILESFINEEFPSSHRSTALSSLNMFVSILYIAIVLIGGKFMDHTRTGLVIFSFGLFAFFLLLPLTFKLLSAQKAHTK